MSFDCTRTIQKKHQHVVFALEGMMGFCHQPQDDSTRYDEGTPQTQKAKERQQRISLQTGEKYRGQSPSFPRGRGSQTGTIVNLLSRSRRDLFSPSTPAIHVIPRFGETISSGPEYMAAGSGNKYKVT